MDIKELRKEIDGINNEMLELFVKRMEVSEQIAEYKRENNMPVIDRAREREILADMSEKAGSDMEKYAYYFFSKIMDLSRAHQHEMLTGESRVRKQIEEALAMAEEVFPQSGLIACQGVEGSNAQIACDKMFPRGHIMYVKSFKAVFDAVDAGLCQFGILPIENSANGSVRAVYELLRERKYPIVRSTKLYISHELLALPGVKLNEIKRIYSHQQAIGQCENFIASLNAEIIPCENTAVAAKRVAESGDREAAAIASSMCAELYGLQTIKEGVQDNNNNYTRFICITKTPVIYEGSNHMSLIVSCNNKPGALNDILSKINAYGINMNKLESCPISGKDFEFMFFLELDASVKEPGVIPLLEDLERSCPIFELIGNYAIV